MNRPHAEPSQIRSGDTLRWSRVIPFYSALQGWTLKYIYTNARGRFVVVSTSRPNSDSHYVDVSAQDSAKFQPGTYAWVATVTNDAGERHTVAQGSCSVLPNVADNDEPIDQRSQAVRSLEAIDAVLEGRADADVEEYEIHGRRVKKMAVDELLRLRSFFAAKVRAEKNANGENVGPRKVLMSFGGCR